MKRYLFITTQFSLLFSLALAQEKATEKQSPWTDHFQLTFIGQQHDGFSAKYSGVKSLADTVEPVATSITTTLFLGRKLWQGAAFYFNPEVSGGNGLSFASGVAGALNGETYRVGAVAPQIFIARGYLQQHFALPNAVNEDVEDDVNQVKDRLPNKRITISAGKFAISDFYDDNTYCKDPRSQFFNWSLWANGAWDYPANTRGYTFGLVAELIHPSWSVRASSVAVPRIANNHLMEYNAHAHSETVEYQQGFFIHKRKGDVRLLFSATQSKAPSYSDGIKAVATKDSFLLNVFGGNAENNVYGGHKYGLGLNIEQELTHEIGFFTRLGWNDGKYSSWAFTEIDETWSGGISVKGDKWKRKDDVCGLAVVVNGISQDHRDFLKAGGYGFIIGDGKLNYDNEKIVEAFYNARVSKTFWLTFDYQFVTNPGYNIDRGPVHVFGMRGHVEF